jgi:hypothetical protein
MEGADKKNPEVETDPLGEIDFDLDVPTAP